MASLGLYHEVIKFISNVNLLNEVIRKTSNLETDLELIWNQVGSFTINKKINANL